MTQQISLKQAVINLQQKIGLSDEEIKYAKDSVGSSNDFLINYHKRLQEVDQIQGQFMKEIQTRNQTIQGIETFLSNNQGSRTKMIKLMLILRQSTINILNLLVKLRKVLGYPVNFDLEVNIDTSPLKQFRDERWLSLEKLSKIIFTVNYFENTPLQIVYNKLVKQKHLCQLENLLFPNENEDPFACSIFVYLQTQYNEKAGENYLMKEYSLEQFEALIRAERGDVANYFKQRQELEQHGYQLVQIPTKFTVGKFEHFFKQKYKKAGAKMLMSDLEKRQQLRQSSMEEFRKQQIREIDYVDSIINLQQELMLSGSEIQFAQKYILGSSNAESQYFTTLITIKQMQSTINNCFQKNEQLVNLIVNEACSFTDFQNYIQNICNLFNTFYMFWQTLNIKVNQYFKCESVCDKILLNFETIVESVGRKLLGMQLSSLMVKYLNNNPENQIRFMFNEQLLTDSQQIQSELQQFWKMMSLKCQIRYDSSDLNSFKIIEIVDDEKDDLEKTLQFILSCNENGAEVCKIPVQPGRVNVFNPITLTDVIVGKDNSINYVNYDQQTHSSKKSDTQYNSRLQLSDLVTESYQSIVDSRQQQQSQQQTVNQFSMVQIPDIQQKSAIQALGIDVQSSDSDNFDINELVK